MKLLIRKSKTCSCGGKLGSMYVNTPSGPRHANCVLDQHLASYYAQHGGASLRQRLQPEERDNVVEPHMQQRSSHMAGHKVDPLKGLNPDQSGPKEKIQNGDPSAGPNRDQRAQTVESGGTKPSLQQGPTGTPEGQVPPHEGLEVVTGTLEPLPAGVSGETLPVGAFDEAGTSPTLSGDEPLRETNDVGKNDDEDTKNKIADEAETK